MFKYIWIVLTKELKDTFRDRKTIFTSFLIPILIFPILAFVIKGGSSDFMDQANEPIDIALISEEKNSLTNYLIQNPHINIVNTKSPEEELKDLNIKAILKVNKNFEEDVLEGKKGKIKIIYDNSSQKSSIAVQRLNSIIQQYSQTIILQRLKNKGIDPTILEAIDIQQDSISKEGGMGKFVAAMILPMLLTIWSAVGGIPSATDLGAGEKERQTLEPLLTTKASRLSLLLGKYFTVVIAAIMGTIAAFIGFIIASKINPEVYGSEVSLAPLSIVVISLVCIGLALVFSGVELAISFYARNFKEAQTYLTPLNIILLIPTYFTMFMDGRSIPEVYFNIPVINSIAIIKEALVPVFNPVHIITVLIWSLIYIGASIFLTVRMFNNESVIFRG